MKRPNGKQTLRAVDIRISFEIPEKLTRHVKDVTLSYHSQEIADDSRAVQVPWTDAVRLVGADDEFRVRMNVPAALPIILHVLTLIDEGAPFELDTPIVCRHIGFATTALAASEDQIHLRVTLFESYALVIPTSSSATHLRAAA